jgi:Tol biopolymer transport system component
MRDNMLVAQPFDADGLTLAGEPVVITDQVELVGPLSGAFAVAASGVVAYQPASGQGSQLVWVDREGRQVGVLGEPGNYGDVDISPDGRRAVVSVLDPSTNTRDLWIFDVARGVRTRFTFDPAEDANPVWSADGSRIMFTSNRGGHYDLYEKATSSVGAEQVVLADETEKYPTSWSPDGASILYWTFDEGTHLWVLPLEGERRPWKFLGPPVNPGRFSPDGNWIAYYSPESGRSEVYIVSFPQPSSRWQISSAGGNLPRWRGDGREVFYASRDNRLMAVTVSRRGAELDVGAPRALFAARPVGPGSFYDASPDGSRFLVNTLREGSAASSIAILQNWDAAPRR